MRGDIRSDDEDDGSGRGDVRSDDEDGCARHDIRSNGEEDGSGSCDIRSHDEYDSPKEYVYDRDSPKDCDHDSPKQGDYDDSEECGDGSDEGNDSPENDNSFLEEERSGSSHRQVCSLRSSRVLVMINRFTDFDLVFLE